MLLFEILPILSEDGEIIRQRIKFGCGMALNSASYERFRFVLREYNKIEQKRHSILGIWLN